MSQRQRIMLLDADSRAALALARYFGSKRIEVIAGGPFCLSRTFFSRFCSARFIYPLNKHRHEVILENVKKFRPDVLMPVYGDSFRLVLSNKRDYVGLTRLIPLPDQAAYEMLDDKKLWMGMAHKAGVSCPESFFPQDRQQLEMLGRELGYPAVIKPRRSCAGRGMHLVRSCKELLAIYDGLWQSTAQDELPFVQEYLTGDVLNFYAYCEGSRIKMHFATKTLRSYPVRFGPGVAARPIEAGVIKELSAAVLAQCSWDGIIGFQYIADERNNNFMLIDCNPRFWGTVENAIFSGIDFPGVMFERALGREVNFPAHYPAGKEFRWLLWGDVLHFLKNPHKIGKMKDFCRWRSTNNEISMTDLFPHLAQTISMFFDRRNAL